MKQWPRYTILRGEVVWDKDNGGLLGKRGYGDFVRRAVWQAAGPKTSGTLWVSEFGRSAHSARNVNTRTYAQLESALCF